MKLSPNLKGMAARKSRRTTASSILVILLNALVFVGCSSASQPGPVAAIEAYQDSLVAGNLDQLVNASCADWEAQARLELDSFTAVTIELVDRACVEAGQDGETTLVTCLGLIEANYGAEVLEIDLADRTYQAVYEGGEWRMCGYR